MKSEYQYLISCVSLMFLMNYFMLYSLENGFSEDDVIYVDWKILKLNTHYDVPSDVLEKLISNVKEVKQRNQRKEQFAQNLRTLYKNDSDESWKRILKMNSTGVHSFNASLSDRVGIYRETLFDTRKEACKDLAYNISELQETSVIIVFHNEAWSTLLRTVHSVLDKSPAPLIKEIILVDDASTYEWLKDPLSDYVDHLEKVRLVRLPRRQGLIRARLRGAREATGEVLYFADAHTECNTGWLEPLLSRIAENRKVLVVPNVDPISWKSLEYLQVAGDYLGAFDWNLVYFYKTLPQHILDTIKDETDPVPNPIMVGCAHAIDRNYFFETGAYDESMEIWGGENIEHSFRLWMCGGRVEMIPCSKIGHIFKPHLSYSFGLHAKNTVARNLVKVAEVWMDEYKDYYYATQASLPAIDVKSMLRRRKLRQDLKCKSFDWYMKTIIPDMPIPPTDARYYGKIFKADNSDKCIIIKEDILKVVDCEKESWKDLTFVIDQNGRFKFEGQCIDVTQSNAPNIVKLEVNSNCNSMWVYNSNFKLIQLSSESLCLQEEENSQEITIQSCVVGSASQMWDFEVAFDFTKKHDAIKVSTERRMIPRKTIRFGAMINIQENYCLNIGDNNEYEMIPCEEQPSYYQTIHFDKDKRLMYENKCVVIVGQRNIAIETCDEGILSQHIWEYDEISKHFYTSLNGNKLCWTFTPDSSSVNLTSCNDSNVHQRWKFFSSSH